MAVHYYCLKKNSEDRKEFNDEIQSIVLFFNEFDIPSKGVIYVSNVKDLKIHYNLLDGKVRADINNPSAKVQNFISAPSVQIYTHPIRAGICALAKLELLLKIAQLEDRELEKFIHSNHYNQHREFVNLTMEHLNLTLQRIQTHTRQPVLFAIFKEEPLTEIHRAVRLALQHHGINQIKCKNDVLLVMEKVYFFLDPKNENKVFSRSNQPT